MSDYHIRTFTWGAGPQKVNVAGGFNNWSETATPLEMEEDGTFAVDVKLPWGERQAYKYVIDGEWMVREDEDKEWDPSGNVNNVYQAPAKPIGSELASKDTAQPIAGGQQAAQPGAPTDIPSSVTAATPTSAYQPQTSGLSTGEQVAIGSGAALAGGAAAAGGVAAASTTSDAKKKKNKKKNEKKKAKKRAERAAASGGVVTGDGDDDDDDEDDSSSNAATSAAPTPALGVSHQLGETSAPVPTQPLPTDSSARALDPTVNQIQGAGVTDPSVRAPVSGTDSTVNQVQGAGVTDPAAHAPVTGASGPASSDFSSTTAPGSQVGQPDRVLVAEYDAKDPSQNFQASQNFQTDSALSGSNDRGLSSHAGAATAGVAALGAAAAGAAGAAYAHSQQSSVPKIDPSNPSIQAFREASNEDDVASAQTFVSKQQEGPVTTTTTVTEIVYEPGHEDSAATGVVSDSRTAEAPSSARDTSAVGEKTSIAGDGGPIANQTDLAQGTATRDGAPIANQADFTKPTTAQAITSDSTPLTQTGDVTGAPTTGIPQEGEFGEKTTQAAQVTESTEPKHESLSHKAAGAVAGAVAGAAALGGAAVLAVKNATGVDIAPEPAPVSIEEAKRRGIDVDHLPQVEGPTDAVSPVGTAPPEGAVSQLQEMVDGLKDPNATVAPVAGVADAATGADVSRSQGVAGTTAVAPTDSAVPSSGAAISSGTAVPSTGASVPAPVGTAGNLQTAAVASEPQSVQDPAYPSQGTGYPTSAQQSAPSYDTTSSAAPVAAGVGDTGYPAQSQEPSVASGVAEQTSAPREYEPDSTFTRTVADPSNPSDTRTQDIGAGIAGAAAGVAAAAGAGYYASTKREGDSAGVGSVGSAPQTQNAGVAGVGSAGSDPQTQDAGIAGVGSTGSVPQTQYAGVDSAAPTQAATSRDVYPADDTFTRTTADSSEPSRYQTGAVGSGATGVDSAGSAPQTQSAAPQAQSGVPQSQNSAPQGQDASLAGVAGGQTTAPREEYAPDSTFTRTTLDSSEPSGTQTGLVGAGASGVDSNTSAPQAQDSGVPRDATTQASTAPQSYANDTTTSPQNYGAEPTITRTTLDSNEPSGTRTAVVGTGAAGVDSTGSAPQTQDAGVAANQTSAPSQGYDPRSTFTRTTVDPSEPSGTHTQAIGAGVAGAAAGVAAAAGAGYYASTKRQGDANIDDKTAQYKLDDEVTGKTSGRDLTFQPADSNDQTKSSSGVTGDKQTLGGPPNGVSREQAYNVTDLHSPGGDSSNKQDKTPFAGEDLEPQPPTGTYGNPTNRPEVKKEVFRAQDTDIPSQRQAAAVNNKTVPAPTITPLKGPVTTSSAAYGGTGTAKLFQTQDRNVLAHQEALEKAENSGEVKRNLSPDEAIGASQSTPAAALAAQQSQTAGSAPASASQQSQVPSSASQQSRAPGVAAAAVPASSQAVGSAGLTPTTGSNVDSAGNIRSPTGAVVGSVTNNAGGEIGTDAPKKAAVATDIADGDGLASVVGLAAKNAGEGVKTGVAGVQGGVNSARDGVTSGIAGVQSSVTSGVSGLQSGATSGLSGIQSGATSGLNSARDGVTSGVSGIQSGVTSGVSGIQSGVTSGVSGIQSGATTGLNSARDGVTSGLSGVQTGATSGLNTARDGVTSGLGGVKSGVAGVAGATGVAGLAGDARSKVGLGNPATPAPPAPSQGAAAASAGGLSAPHEKHSGSFSKRFSSLGFGKRHSHHSGADEPKASDTYAATQSGRPVSAYPASGAGTDAAGASTLGRTTGTAAAGDFGAGAGSAATGTIGKATGAQQGSAFTSSTATHGNDATHAGGSSFLNKDPAAPNSPVVKKKKSGFFSKLKHAFKH